MLFFGKKNFNKLNFESKNFYRDTIIIFSLKNDSPMIIVIIKQALISNKRLRAKKFYFISIKNNRRLDFVNVIVKIRDPGLEK